MQTPVPYAPPSKGLLSELKAEVQALAHERLAQHLRWYQNFHALGDDEIARQMNGCARVIGIRGRKGDAVHAPISEAKIARFKDGRTRPQRQTLDQMTAFFAEKLDAKPFLYWADMDDVLSGYHDARRFRKERLPKGLIALTKGWINTVLGQPGCALYLQLSPMNAAPVILVRGRLVMYQSLLNVDDHPDVFVHGYGTLTADNLNLYVRDAQGRQVIVYMDVTAGPVENDPARTPFLFIRQTTLSLPPAFEFSDQPHPYRLRTGTPISEDKRKTLQKRRPGDPIPPNRLNIDAFHLNAMNTGTPDYDAELADLVFAIEPGKPWAMSAAKTKS